MKLTLVAAATLALATGATAQLSTSTPLQILQYGSLLLSSSCRTTVTGLLAANSSLSQCIQVPALLPILLNNQTSVIPNINTYLIGLCNSSACEPSVITNATQSILTSCAKDLSNFGISNKTVETIASTYPTVREAACLSSNATGNSTLCPIQALYGLESYLSVNLTNSFIDSAILGANATAYQQIISIPSNATLLKQFGCTDCVAATADLVLENYPQLENFTFTLPDTKIVNETGLGLQTGANYTISSLYEDVCQIPIGDNVTFPSSINETAFNTTLPFNMTASPVQNVTRRWVRWD